MIRVDGGGITVELNIYTEFVRRQGMERALVVLNGREHEDDLLREAAELAAGVDAELVLLRLLTAEEVEEDVEMLSQISNTEDIGYSKETVRKSVMKEIETHATTIFDDLDVSFTPVAVVYDDEAETIIETAEKHDCDHVFIAGRKRSPAGKVVFGDTTQSVLLNFEGRITVQLA